LDSLRKPREWFRNPILLRLRFSLFLTLTLQRMTRIHTNRASNDPSQLPRTPVFTHALVY
jgi:hypothetical protein